MHKALLVFLLLLPLHLFADDDVSRTFPPGVVFGIKGAFKISPPDGWLVDNYSGQGDGQPVVLYPKGGSWAKSQTVMYAKIASDNYPKMDRFIEFTLDYFQKKDAGFKYRNVVSSKTKEGFQYVIQEYDRPSYPVYELTAYIQMPNSVAYIVYSGATKEQRENDLLAFRNVLESFEYVPVFVQDDT